MVAESKPYKWSVKLVAILGTKREYLNLKQTVRKKH
jgi:hypothetical protein